MAIQYDYGLDLACTSDILPNAGEVSGLDNLTQALYRRLITARGGLIDDPAYGFDTTTLVDEAQTRRQVAMIASQIDGELTKDERVRRSQTTGEFVQTSLSSGKYIATIEITTADGPFQMVMAVSRVTVELLQPLR